MSMWQSTPFRPDRVETEIVSAKRPEDEVTGDLVAYANRLPALVSTNTVPVLSGS
jgi:hypothetical protein